MQWDYIIVGAGSAGCALAYELVRSGRTVLVIEAGGSDRSPLIKIPACAWRVSAQHDWGYHSQPDPSRDGAAERWLRGRVLGGTSSINGMVYMRGVAQDFDRWAQHCGHVGGWSSSEVIPIFRELERSDQRSPLRGRSGPLYVRTVKRPHPLTDAFIESAYAAGYPFNPDYNGGTQEGVGYLQYTQRRGLRWSAADAFLKPLLGRKNLKLRLNASVEKIEVSIKGRALAVAFRHKGKLYRETARDIVLSAGVINSPKLLMLSGIGDPEELRRHKIDVVLDLPGVGRNLKEQPLVELDYRSRIPTYNLTEGLLQKLVIAAKYLCFREGPISAVYESVALLKTTAAAALPELQIVFAPIGFRGTVDGSLELTPFPALKFVILRSHPISSGSIRLASNNPCTPPLIECRLLESQVDVDILVRGIEMVRNIVKTKPIANLIEAEITPGDVIEGVQALREYIRSHAEQPCQPIGTCRMGVGADAVVDPDLRVHGTENLWIADASIMPDHLSANTNAVCMMIGAKLGRQLNSRR